MYHRSWERRKIERRGLIIIRVTKQAKVGVTQWYDKYQGGPRYNNYDQPLVDNVLASTPGFF